MSLVEGSLIDSSANLYVKKVLGHRPVFVSGLTGVGKTSFCINLLIRYFSEKRVAAADPYGEIFTTKKPMNAQNYDVNNPSFMSCNADIWYIDECNGENAGTLVKILTAKYPVLTTIIGYDVDHAVQHLLMTMKYANPVMNLSNLYEIFKVARPIVIHLKKRNEQFYIEKIVEYGEERREIHLI
jgi:type IV secretory pathway ATPase VirB11/archaellum biosynthesis ATPase